MGDMRREEESKSELKVSQESMIALNAKVINLGKVGGLSEQ